MCVWFGFALLPPRLGKDVSTQVVDTEATAKAKAEYEQKKEAGELKDEEKDKEPGDVMKTQWEKEW